MNAQVPAWLETALAENQSESKRAVAAPIRPGDIRRLEPMDAGSADPLLVLVTGIDDLNACASVMVVSPEVEMGTDADLLLPREVSDLPYDLVVLPDVIGPAWFVQLGHAVRTAVIYSVLDAAGITLRDMQDARWAWKESQLEALVALTAECRYQLLDGEPATIADPAAFDLSFVDIKEQTCMTLATVRLLGTQAIRVPTAALRFMPADQTSLPYECFMALSQAIQRHSSLVIRNSSRGGGDLPLRRELADDPLPGAVSGLLEKLDNAVRCIKVASVSTLWTHPNLGARSGFFEFVSNGKRHQLVIANVDSQESCCA